MVHSNESGQSSKRVRSSSPVNPYFRKDASRLIVFALWAIVIVGIPLWWKTTEVYRAALPHEKIDKWAVLPVNNLTIPVSIFINIANGISMENIQKDFSQYLTQAFSTYNCVDFSISTHVTTWSSSLDSKEDILNWHSDAPLGHYYIYVGQSTPEKPTQSDVIDITVGTKKSTLIQMHRNNQDELLHALESLSNLFFMDEFEDINTMVCTGYNNNNDDADSMRTLKYAPKYQITFSLMNNDLSKTAWDWNIRSAVNEYFSPFQKEISKVSNFTVTSQVQNYASLSIIPKLSGQESSAHYSFAPEQLPHFVNLAEWNLASTIASYPNINFIVYIPSKDITPLHIHDSKGQVVPSDAFLIPRWGGVIVKNLDQIDSDDTIDMKSIMEVFVSQLRRLIGVPSFEEIASKIESKYRVTLLPSRQHGITQLEKCSLFRRRTVENMINTILTLKSLSTLVTDIPNMIVPDHIGVQIEQSLYSVQMTRDLLYDGRLEDALQYSIDAITLAEKAFFDPTMVSMLYFPDEHKYAIYMPLFVPISVPLVIALLKEYKKSKKKNQSKATKTNKTE